MGFEIELKVQKRNWTIRGNDNGTVDLCQVVMMKNPTTKEMESTLVPREFYHTISGALDSILKKRVCNSDAITLTELKAIVKKEYENLQEMYDPLVGVEGEMRKKRWKEKPALDVLKNAPVEEAPEAPEEAPKRRKVRPNRKSKASAPVEEVEEPVKSSRRKRPTRRRD